MIQLTAMFEDTKMIRSHFARLGLEAEIVDIYLALHIYGPQTLSELSRHSGIERTRIYRLLDTLLASNLIEQETAYKRTIIKAAPITNLQILLSKKEEELRSLRAEMPEIQRILSGNIRSIQNTKVQVYKDSEGLKQLFWNQTRGTSENLAILHENMQNRTNGAFFEQWVSEINRNHIVSRGLIDEHFIETQKQWYKNKNNERIQEWSARFLPPHLYRPTHSTVIYDNVVAYYSWQEGNIFGIEIYNQDIADAQRAFFNLLWAQSTPVSNQLTQQLSPEVEV